MFDRLSESCNVSVRAIQKSTGKVLHERIGHNVWTNTGREYSCLLKTRTPNGDPYRQDLISYMGLGSGSQPETVNVIRVEDPVPFTQGTWLKPIVDARTVFQTTGSGVRTSGRYVCTYSEKEFIFGGAG